MEYSDSFNKSNDAEFDQKLDRFGEMLGQS